jgi:hypothetical protein
MQMSKATKDKQKTLSILFKLMHKNESPDDLFITKKPKDSYVNHLNNFNQHSKELRNAIAQTQENPDHTETVTRIRSKIITEDLMPLRYKIKNILSYIKSNNLYLLNYHDQTANKIKHSPRIQIIDTMITSLKDDTFQLNDKIVEHYQCIMNYIAHFSAEKNHDNMANTEILTALETVSLNNKNEAQKLATLLHEETLNKKILKKCINTCSL